LLTLKLVGANENFKERKRRYFEMISCQNH